MKTAVVFLADGFEEVEALTPVDYLRRAGAEVFTVAVPSPTMNDEYIATGSHKIPVITDMSFKEFKAEFTDELPDLVFCPGGMPGSKNLGNNQDVLDFMKRCFDAEKYVSAICAAPAVVLAKTGVLQNKNWTCYPGMETSVEEYCGSAELAEEVMKGSTHKRDVPFITDGNVITSRGAGTAEQFAMELVRLLCGDEVVAKLKAACCQR
ncbi:MAG: DJ-1/PfpI family protein [Treponema sp.]|nr:DJ-1/PfpI family protein [Treponema sp.]